MENEKNKIITFTRQELYELVWSTPMLTISKKFRISDTGFRKMCLRMKVPTPPPGYWRQVEVGGKPRKTRLNPNQIPAQKSITLVMRAENSEIASPITLLKKQVELEHPDDLVIPGHFRKPHDLIIEAKNSYKERDKWQTKSLLETGVYKPHCSLYLMISPKNRNRSLRFLDAFIKLMLKRGHGIEKSSLIIKGHRCPFAVEEILEKDSQGKQIRTGRLTFQIQGRVGWHKISDGATSLIESKLANIVATIEDSVNRKIKEEIELAERQAYWREQQRIEKERKDKIVNEIKQFQELIKNAKRFQEVNLVRDYLRHIAIAATRKGEFNEELVSFVEWGKKKCDWYDPSILHQDEILVDADRDKIEIDPKKEDRPWPGYSHF